MDNPLRSAFHVSCRVSWLESGRRHHKESEEGRKTRKKEEEESVFEDPDLKNMEDHTYHLA